jgi:hypothetical protein
VPGTIRPFEIFPTGAHRQLGRSLPIQVVILHEALAAGMIFSFGRQQWRMQQFSRRAVF